MVYAKWEVGGQGNAHRGQRKTLSGLQNHSLPSSFDTGSFMEPRLLDWQPVSPTGPSASAFNSTEGVRHVGPTNSNFLRGGDLNPSPLPLTLWSPPPPRSLCLIKPLSRRFLLSRARLFYVDNCGNISPDRRIFHTLCLTSPQITT